MGIRVPPEVSKQLQQIVLDEDSSVEVLLDGEAISQIANHCRQASKIKPAHNKACMHIQKGAEALRNKVLYFYY